MPQLETSSAELQEQLREGEEELKLIAREKKVAGVGTPPAARSGKGQSKRELDPIIERLERMNEIQDEIIAIREDLKVWQSSRCRNRAKADIKALKAEYELLEAEHSRCKPLKVAKTVIQTA